jgi:hypothetical protein
MDPRSLRWWYWTSTAGLLGAALAGWGPGLAAAAAWVAFQLAHYLAREGTLRAFPAQTRIAYLALLAAGTWPPLGFVHVLQLAGTCISVTTGYCLLARLVSLLPWNRTQPLTLERLGRTFATGPVKGSVLHVLDR